MKRYQECNKIEKLWRKRLYCLLPFQWIWYSTVVKLKCWEDVVVDGKLKPTGKYEIIRGNHLWRLLKSKAHTKMKWYYTHEEFKKRFDELICSTKKK